MAKETRSSILREIDKLEPKIAAQLRQAIGDVKSTAQLKLLAAAIEEGDTARVLALLRFAPEFFAPLDRAIDEAFYAGGAFALANLPKKPLLKSPSASAVLRFQGRSPRAEQWLKEKSSTLISGLDAEAQKSVRFVLSEGARKGQNPINTARDLRSIVGLNGPQVEAVIKAKAELSNPDRMAGYLQRNRRDKRFDSVVKRAMGQGKPLTTLEVRKIAGRYGERLLKLRTETISRTETTQAFNSGRVEGLQQAIDSGRLEKSQVFLVWSATGDGRTRDHHVNMSGQKIAFGQSFRSPTGAQLKYPSDTSLGAGGADVINCRCTYTTKVDFLKRN